MFLPKSAIVSYANILGGLKKTMQNTALQEALPVNVKSFNIVRAITDKNLFSKVKLSPTARLVLFNLANMYNLKKGCSFPKIEKLTLCTGATEKSVITALNELRTNNLIVSSKDRYRINYYFTNNFFSLLEIFSNETENISSQPVKITVTCHEQKKEQNIKQKKEQDNFSFKNLVELSKTNTIAYYEEILNLSDQDKEHLCKIKLGRMSLTDFQKVNMDKFILLSDSEIIAVNNKEPYHRQENIDIFYTNRIRKVREGQEQAQKQEETTIRNQKEETLAMLKAGYKAFSNNKAHLISFLNRNKAKMFHFNITELDLCC